MRRPAVRFRAALVVLAALPWLRVGPVLAEPESPPAASLPDPVPFDAFLGTWVGESKCVGDRPGCKGEVVFYRFVALEGQPERLRLLADKFSGGARVPMGALVLERDPGTGGLRCELTAGETHGVWTYTIAYGALKGSLVILPEGSVARDVIAHSALESEMPAAPALDAYEE